MNAGLSPSIVLSRSFGEGLLARMTKDEARARNAFEAARAQQEKIVQAQPDYGPADPRAIALTPVEKDVYNGSRVLQYFAITAAWAGEQGPRLAATGSWAARSPGIAHAELRCLKTVPGLGPAPRRSALRANRRLACPERMM